MEYIKVQLSIPYEKVLYQCIENGQVQMYKEEDGSYFVMPEPNECSVIDGNPPIPAFAIIPEEIV